MAVIKAADIVDFVIKAKDAGWGYVFGGQGQVYTRALAEKWAAAKKSGRGYDYYVVQCARWFGKIVVDCSGLVIEAYRSKIPGYGDKTANTIYSKSVQKGKIATIPEIPGLCVWRSGHIGVYIGNGKVIESGGTNIGVVLSKLTAPASNKKWTNWGKMADVDYTNTTTPKQPDPSSCWLGRYLKIKAPYMRGEDVEQVQQALKSSGFDPGAIDGIYGPYTERAVKAFQAKKGLVVDGIVGPDTTKTLLGCWVTDHNGKPCCPSTETQLDSFELGRLLKVASPYMRGDDVTDVQYALAYNNFSPGSIDGIFGPKTESAVKGFQRKKKIKVDGIVGPETTNMLGGTWTGA
jgi:peptidoglycan hydrolase-like protein with peptidoglycan-binding domain